MDVAKILKERIRTTRQEKGWTIHQLSDAAFLSENSVSCYERGERLPSVLSLASIAKALGVTTDYLLGGNNDVKHQ